MVIDEEAKSPVYVHCHNIRLEESLFQIKIFAKVSERIFIGSLRTSDFQDKVQGRTSINYLN